MDFPMDPRQLRMARRFTACRCELHQRPAIRLSAAQWVISPRADLMQGHATEADDGGVQWFPGRCESSWEFMNGKGVRTLLEQFKVGAQKIVYGPPGVIFVPFLHDFAGMAEGFEFWRLCRTDGGDKEIDA